MEGATMARVFKIYVERVLAPSLWSGQIVVMDNLSAHGPARVGELIEKRLRVALSAGLLARLRADSRGARQDQEPAPWQRPGSEGFW
jgi:transposase